jgi:ribose transport system ATP-binding protein
MSVAQNLMLGRARAGDAGTPGRRRSPRLPFVDEDADEAAARDLLARFGETRIDPRAPVGSLGIGVQQVVEIVRALADDARVLVLDEPTAALTTDETERLLAWLRGLRERGTTCIYVSHRMDEVLALCDRITILRDGRTAGTVITAATTGAAIVRLMVGRDLPARDPHSSRIECNSPAEETHSSRTECNLKGAEEHSSRIECKSETASKHSSVIECGDAGAVRLRVRDLSVAGALDCVSLDVRAGELVAVCGALGSGRTALLSTLFGCATRRPRGEVLLDGAPAMLSSPRAAIRAGLALVPEDRKARGLVLDLTVAENLALPLALADEAEAELIARARIAELRIRGAADAPVATLSGGNQQKVVLGKWLHRPPRVLLLDEPTRGVDIGAREEIYALIGALLARGVAILMASSDLGEAQRLAHRIVVLRRGRVAATLPAGATQDQIVALSTGLTSDSCAH